MTVSVEKRTFFRMSNEKMYIIRVNECMGLKGKDHANTVQSTNIHMSSSVV